MTGLVLLTDMQAIDYLKQRFAIIRSFSTMRNYRYYGGGPVYIKVGTGRAAAVRYRPADLDAWAAKGLSFHTDTHDPGTPLTAEDLAP
jgi:hypothetical protein